MGTILKPLRQGTDTSHPISFRVPAEMHRRLQQLSDRARKKGMRLTWQQEMVGHLEDYMRLADRELREQGKNDNRNLSFSA